MIEQDIVAAYYYEAGAIENIMYHDQQLKEAVRLLENEEEYKSVLEKVAKSEQ